MTKAKSKIHFVALIGVAVDADIFAYWIPHYKALAFDSYSVFLHASPDVGESQKAEALFIDEGFRVTMLPEGSIRNNPVCPGDPGLGVRSIIMDLASLSMDEGDFIVTADGDEFQYWPEAPREMVARGIKLVTGNLIDCFDDTLHAPDPKKTLKENYPTEYFDLSALWKTNPYNMNKICLSPARYPVDFSGSHGLKRHHAEVAPTVFASGPIAVMHYRWRESALLRVKNRPGWPEHEIAFIKNFFSVVE